MLLNDLQTPDAVLHGTVPDSAWFKQKMEHKTSSWPSCTDNATKNSNPYEKPDLIFDMDSVKVRFKIVDTRRTVLHRHRCR